MPVCDTSQLFQYTGILFFDFVTVRFKHRYAFNLVFSSNIIVWILLVYSFCSGPISSLCALAPTRTNLILNQLFRTNLNLSIPSLQPLLCVNQYTARLSFSTLDCNLEYPIYKWFDLPSAQMRRLIKVLSLQIKQGMTIFSFTHRVYIINTGLLLDFEIGECYSQTNQATKFYRWWLVNSRRRTCLYSYFKTMALELSQYILQFAGYLESKYYAMEANNFYQLNSSHIDLFHGDKH